MSMLVVGLSHHCAPLELLERAALNRADAAQLGRTLAAGAAVREVAVLATCNRLEVYAEVESFHGGLTEIGSALVTATGVDLRTLSSHLFAYHGEDAVRHLFTVACGMDSMALGESQVLGQVRDMLTAAQANDTLGRSLDPLLQRALRVGKRAFAETGLATTGHSLIGQALAQASALGIELDRARALVVGAGSMSSLAATSLSRQGAGHIVIANRSLERGERLATAVSGRAVALGSAEFLDELASADIVVSCTGAAGQMLTLDLVRQARQRRAQATNGQATNGQATNGQATNGEATNGQATNGEATNGEATKGEVANAAPAPQLLVDLALPHDIDPEAGELPGVRLVNLAALHADLAGLGVGDDLNAVTDIIDAEVDLAVAAQRADQVAPTVIALRRYAEEVVQAELERLRGRLGDDLDPRVAAEVERTVHRVVDKLLHRPTVRVKALASQAEQDERADSPHYAEILADLFDLQIDTAGGTIHDLSEALAVEVIRS